MLALIVPATVPSLVSAQAHDLRAVDLPRWELAEDLRLGSVDGEWDAFHRPAGVHETTSGDVVVLDLGIPAFRVFDARGRFIREVGGRGDGPGEFRAPMASGVQGDTLWVADQRLGRLILYAVTGDVLSSYAWNRLVLRVGGEETVMPVAPGGDGRFVGLVPAVPDLTRITEAGPLSFTQYVVEVSAEGAVTDTLGSLERHQPGVFLAGGGGLSYDPVPREPIYAFSEGGSRMVRVERPSWDGGDTPTFAVEQRALAEDRRVRMEFEYEALAIPAEARRRLEEELDLRLRQLPGPASQAVAPHLTIPDHQPPVSAVSLGADGTVWLLRERYRSDPHWLVLGSDLAPLATVPVPEGRSREDGALGVQVRAIGRNSGRTLWLRHQGEWDEPILVRYRVER